MQKRIVWLWSFFLLCSTTLAVATASANQFGFAKNALVTYFESSYFQTKSNFDPAGNSSPLLNNNQFTELRFDIGAAYDFSNRLEIYGDGNFKKQDAIINNGPGLGGVEKANSLPGDLTLGLNYLLLQGFVSVIPDFSVSVPMYPGPGSDSNPLIGDGAVAGSFKLYLTKQMRSFMISAYAGYTFRNQGYASLIPYGALAHLELGPVYLQGGIAGAGSQNNDQYTNNPIPRFQIDTLNDGGSLIYNAVNPSWLNANASLGIRLSRQFFISGGIDTTLLGQDIAQGTRFIVGLGYSTVPTKTPERHNNGNDHEELKDHEGSGDFEVDTTPEDSTIPGEVIHGEEDKRYRNEKIFAPTR